MYLLYLDDSGSANNPNEEYLVLGGISVFERRVYFLSKQLDELAAKYHAADPDSVEFHASEIFRGKTHPWGELKTPSVRKQVLHEVLFSLTTGTGLAHLHARCIKNRSRTMIL
jgi:hypothetical protein